MSPQHVAAAALLVAGLLVLERALRPVASRAAARGACALLLGGTALVWAVAPAAEVRAAAAFAMTAGAVAWMARTTRTSGAVAGGLLGVGLAAAVAQGPDLLRLQPPRPVEALFSSRHGLLFWSPVLWLALGGLAGLWRRRRPLGVGVLASFPGGLLLLSCPPAGPSGPWAVARWTALLPLLAPGLAVTLDALVRIAARRPLVLPAAAGGLLVAWNLLLMEQYRTGRIPRDDTVSFSAVAENSAAIAAQLVGSPPAWPANWAFAWRHSATPDRFDLVSGKRLRGADGGALEVDVGELGSDAALLLEGWSVRHPCGDAVCRAVDGRARLLAPLEAPEQLLLCVHAAGEGELSVTLNGVALGTRPLRPGLACLRFGGEVRWRRLNELTFAVGPGGHALVDRVRLERPGSAS